MYIHVTYTIIDVQSKSDNQRTKFTMLDKLAEHILVTISSSDLVFQSLRRAIHIVEGSEIWDDVIVTFYVHNYTCHMTGR